MKCEWHIFNVLRTSLKRLEGGESATEICYVRRQIGSLWHARSFLGSWFDTSEMSLAAVPTDILILLISTNLKNRTADLLALSHTCKRFHALLLKHRSWQSDQKYFFEHTYCEIFRQGSVSQLEWFCKWYRFPRLSEGHFFLKDCLICAAKGTIIFFAVLGSGLPLPLDDRNWSWSLVITMLS